MTKTQLWRIDESANPDHGRSILYNYVVLEMLTHFLRFQISEGTHVPPDQICGTPYKWRLCSCVLIVVGLSKSKIVLS